jgi:hypothetical protein
MVHRDRSAQGEPTSVLRAASFGTQAPAVRVPHAVGSFALAALILLATLSGLMVIALLR